MTRTYLRDRQARRRQEGQEDMQNRCAFCKRALKTAAVFDLITGKKYCNDDCAADDAERTALMEARRR